MSQSTNNARKSRVVGKLFVDCFAQSHIVYESEGRHCTAICGKYIYGLPDRDRSELAKCRQCLSGNLRTKIPVYLKDNELSPMERNVFKSRQGRRIYKRKG